MAPTHKQDPQQASRARKSLPIASEPQYSFRSARDDDPVDAEWAEPSEWSKRWEEWSQRWQQAKDHFATGAQRQYEQMRARRERLRQQRDAEPGPLTDREELSLLRENIHAAGDAYMKSLRDSSILAPGFNDDDREEKLSAMHNIYAQMMVATCMRPLRNGVNANSVVRAATTMTTLTLLSPTFRDVVGEHLAPVRSAVKSRIDSFVDNRMDQATRAAEFDELVLGRKSDPRQKLNVLLRRRWDAMQYERRGNRELYTPRSAGMTEVALTEAAFRRMRQPGVDVVQVKNSYDSMIKLLYRQAEDDGIDREQLAQSSRLLLGERMRQDPRLQAMVEGFSHGRYQRTGSREVRLPGSDETLTTWSGDFATPDGEIVDLNRYADPESKDQIIGAFTLRSSEGPDKHRERMAETMTATMSDAIRQGDLDQFNQNLAGYLLGCVAKAKKFDGEGLPGVVPERLFQSRTMLASMVADGLSAEDQRATFSHAYTDAVQAVQEANPEFAQQWNERYGRQWDQFTDVVGNDPAKAYELWQAAQQSAGDQQAQAQAAHDGAGTAQQTQPPREEYQPGPV